MCEKRLQISDSELNYLCVLSHLLARCEERTDLPTVETWSVKKKRLYYVCSVVQVLPTPRLSYVISDVAWTQPPSPILCSPVSLYLIPGHIMRVYTDSKKRDIPITSKLKSCMKPVPGVRFRILYIIQRPSKQIFGNDYK
ncbi:hypothetical protein V1477_018302 [Vespula maculifrons]|uniref:Uncharacterized protein n=1 Tax=Vespula maculifrons TaxID=7453 RepID=A0ABD2AZ23_VESMC